VCAWAGDAPTSAQFPLALGLDDADGSAFIARIGVAATLTRAAENNCLSDMYTYMFVHPLAVE
jgi:hypothetical protein